MDNNLPPPFYLLGLGEVVPEEQVETMRRQISMYYMLGLGKVMTDEQLETLRRQIAVYSTISKQLVEIYSANVSVPGSAQSSLAGSVARRHMAYDPFMGTLSPKITTQQRWTPTQSQLQILERLFDQADGTPNKTRIKEITTELSQHGQIAETNVYNWFQNRKAKAKRKQQMVSTKNGESEGATNIDSPKEMKLRFDEDSGQECPNGRGRAETAAGQSSDGDVALDQKPSIGDRFDS